MGCYRIGRRPATVAPGSLDPARLQLRTVSVGAAARRRCHPVRQLGRRCDHLEDGDEEIPLMVKLTLPNEIINETPADATPGEQNYSYIQQHVNNEQINRDGSVAMTAQLHLVGDPLNPTDAASKGYVDAVLPVGIMLPFGGIVAPAGSWALCNGAVLTTSLYPKLFAVLQYRFGGSGANFNLPDLRGRVPVGLDGSANYNIVGRVGGTLTVP